MSNRGAYAMIARSVDIETREPMRPGDDKGLIRPLPIRKIAPEKRASFSAQGAGGIDSQRTSHSRSRFERMAARIQAVFQARLHYIRPAPRKLSPEACQSSSHRTAY
jgi:hypothetical protein